MLKPSDDRFLLQNLTSNPPNQQLNLRRDGSFYVNQAKRMSSVALFQEIQREIAASGPHVSAWGIDRFYEPQHPDAELRKYGLAIYDRMIRDDPQVKAAMRFKQHSIVSGDWDVMPARDGDDDPTPEAEDHASFIKENFEQMRGEFRETLLSVLDGLAKGFSIHELVVENREGSIWLHSLKPKPQETFDFETDDFGNLQPDGLIQFKDTIDEMRLPVSKFLVYTHQGKPGDFYGESDLRPVIRYSLAKLRVDDMWNVSLEKTAKGIPVAYVPPGTPEDVQEAMLAQLESFQIQSAAVFENNVTLEYIQASQTQFDSFESKERYCDVMINRALLIPDLVTSEGERVGSKALGTVHGQAFSKVCNLSASSLCDSINEQVIRRLILANFPSTTQFPELTIKTVDLTERQALMELYGMMIEKGITIDESFIRSQFDVPEPTEEPEDEAPIPLTTNPEEDIEDVEEDEAQAQFQQGREKNKFEQKLNLPQIERALDKLERFGVSRLETVFRNMRHILLEQIHSEPNKDQFDVHTPDIQAVLQAVLTWGYLQGEFDGLRETRRADRSLRQVEFQTEPVELGDLAPEAAIQFFRSKVPIPFDTIDTYSRLAFTIASDLTSKMLRQVQLIILKGLERGVSRTKLQDNLLSLFRGMLTSGETQDGALLTPHRVENIVRTNLIEAYNTGRLDMFRHPDVADRVGAVEYSAIIDSRTTPFCRAWDGAVLRLNDPQLDQITPPNHFQCRSILVPIMRVEKFEVTELLPSERPLEGFRI